MTLSDASRDERQRDRKHIFCVNGAAEFLALLAILFEDERYNVTTTNYLPRTFEQIAASQPDLIIVDLVVGIRSGWDLRSGPSNEISSIRSNRITSGCCVRAEVH